MEQYQTPPSLMPPKYIKVKEESEKVGLKPNFQKTKIMASGPITSCQIDEETMETVTDFVLRGSKITADGDCESLVLNLERHWDSGPPEEKNSIWGQR